MITFAQYITEGTLPFEVISRTVDEHLKKGEIMKQDFEDLKRAANRNLEDEIKPLHTKYFYGKGSAYRGTPLEAADDAFYYGLDSVRAVAGKLKKAAKLPQKEQMVKDYMSFLPKYAELSSKIDQLKGMIVTVTQKRAEKKEVEAKAQAKRFTDAKSLTSTLLTHRDDFVNEASKRGGEYWKHHMNVLKKGGGLDKVAPRPTNKMNRDDYLSASRKRQFYQSIQTGSLESYAKMYADAAHEDYMSWVHKLTAKIGKPVAKSSITGSPWQGSTINVTCNDGEEQTWHTQMIINHSKFGKPFNQFPTRRKK